MFARAAHAFKLAACLSLCRVAFASTDTIVGVQRRLRIGGGRRETLANGVLLCMQCQTRRGEYKYKYKYKIYS